MISVYHDGQNGLEATMFEEIVEAFEKFIAFP